MPAVLHRTFLSAVLVIAMIIGVTGGTTHSEAASSSTQKMLEMRNSRLQKRLSKLKKGSRVVAASSRSSSSASSSNAWEVFRLSKRRGGGGSPQHDTVISSTVTAIAPTLVDPTITFGDITKNYGAANFTLAPTSNSDGAFTFLSSDPSVATISGNTVTIVHAGTTTISATQGQDGNFQEKTVAAVLTVNTIAPTIIPLISITKLSSSPPFMLADPTSNSAGAFTFTSTNAAVATVTGRTVLIMGVGTTTIISTQAANGNYKSGSGTTTLTVNVDLSDA